VNINPYVSRWNEPPPMDVGSPLPAIKNNGDRLWVCYICKNPNFPGWESGASPDHPGFEIYKAVLRFDGVVSHHLGPPSAEKLYKHPLHSFGLEFYQFHEAFNTPALTEHKGKRHWIITFHDETLEVIADQATVVERDIDGEDTQSPIQKMS
jgi:hypothetical protein